MRVQILVASALGAIVCFAAGWTAAGCAAETPPAGNAAEGLSLGGGSASPWSACPPCVTDEDCHGEVCAQFGGDTYCAPSCAIAGECSDERACTGVATVTGERTSVCVPRMNACGEPVSPVPRAA